MMRKSVILNNKIWVVYLEKYILYLHLVKNKQFKKINI